MVNLIIPKYVKEIRLHLLKCAYAQFNGKEDENGCKFCSNVLSFALIFAEQNNMFKDEDFLSPNNRDRFWKLIQSMTERDNKCPNAISYKSEKDKSNIFKFFKWLCNLSINQSKEFRNNLLPANAEFQD